MYKFFEGENKKGKFVICVSSFAGKPVRGIAKCNGDVDEYDVEFGKKIAQLRCDQKVAEKRIARAKQKLEAANKAVDLAETSVIRMQRYLDDSVKDLERVTSVLNNTLNSLD